LEAPSPWRSVGEALRGGPLPEYPTYVPEPLIWDSTKDEMIFGIVGPGGDFQYEFNFTFIVAFWSVSTTLIQPGVGV
jgi:hypothetical protein